MDFLTIGAVREQTGISTQTLRRYADAGWIDCEVDSTGRRIFTEKAVEQARRVYEIRTGKRAA